MVYSHTFHGRDGDRPCDCSWDAEEAECTCKYYDDDPQTGQTANPACPTHGRAREGSST